MCTKIRCRHHSIAPIYVSFVYQGRLIILVRLSVEYFKDLCRFDCKWVIGIDSGRTLVKTSQLLLYSL